MGSIILSLLKSKTTWTVLIFAMVLSYYNVEAWGLRRTISEQEVQIEKLDMSLRTCTSNFEDTVSINAENIKTMSECVSNSEILNRQYSNIVDDKDKLIIKLRNTISDALKPIVYPREIIYKECVVKIKGNEDVENDDTLSGLNNIGN